MQHYSLFQNRVISGMRPTGNLHLGHYHGVLTNWLQLQNEHECLFFVADIHALTTQYQQPELIYEHSYQMVVDWLASGIDPEKAIIFIQSQVPQHAELHLLLSMLTPLGWLERVPSYKDQQINLKDKDLATYGFLGYPLLQAADILLYHGTSVPVGEDQMVHIEFTREIARRFNVHYGRKEEFVTEVDSILDSILKDDKKLLIKLKKIYRERGEIASLDQAYRLIAGLEISEQQKRVVLGFFEVDAKMILPLPQPMLTPASKMVGLDGQKMSKSYNNTISLRDDTKSVTRKIATMKTDPKRIRRNDPGEPECCPVWSLHTIYSDASAKTWVMEGCREGKIGCVECKAHVADCINRQLEPFHDRIKQYNDRSKVERFIADGTCRARELAEHNMQAIRAAVGLSKNA